MKPDGLQADWALLFAALKDLRSILSVDFGQPIFLGGGEGGYSGLSKLKWAGWEDSSYHNKLSSSVPVAFLFAQSMVGEESWIAAPWAIWEWGL